jgi:CheY-like chemotaxis protein
VEHALRFTAHEFAHRAKVVTEVHVVPAVNMDETQLGQILVNLLVNAAHAIQPGDTDHNLVTLRVRLESDSLVLIELHDTGGGMARDVLNHIFEPFFTTKEVGAGTGLGLSICHGIVTAVGGRIEAESTPGEGSTFRVFLPVAKAKQLPPPELAPQGQEKHARILIIEDEEMILSLFALALREHEVRTTTSAEEALALLEADESFDLIVCDLMMPNMSGVDFYERLLVSRPELARRVVFLTGGAMGSRVSDFLQSVPNPCLFKPFELSDLRKSIRMLLEQKAPAMSSETKCVAVSLAR